MTTLKFVSFKEIKEIMTTPCPECGYEKVFVPVTDDFIVQEYAYCAKCRFKRPHYKEVK